MKKLALSLLLSTSLLVNTFTTGSTTTNLGAIQIITPNGINTFGPGEVNLWGTINIGNSSSDIITLSGAGIVPISGGQVFLMINDTGQLITENGTNPITIGSLTAATLTTESVNLGIPADNYLSFTSDSGNILLQANAGDLNLSTTGSINIASLEVLSNINSLLAINNGKLTINNSSTSGVLGFLNISNSLSIGNTLINSTGNITIDANTTGANLSLMAANNIYISNNNITPGTLLATDATNGYLMSANSSTNATFGILASTDFTAITGNITATEGNITAPTGNINGASMTITSLPSVLLATDINGNLKASDNTINATVGNLICNGLQDTSITTAGLLAVDSNGNITSANNSNPSFNNITCAELQITGVTSSVLATDDVGNIIATNSLTPATFGNVSAEYLQLRGLTTAGALLTIDDSGNVLEASASANINCGNLTATGNIALGGGSNTFTINGLNINQNYTVLAVDNANNVMTSNATNSSFTMGDISNNNINVDNTTNLATNGITLNSSNLYLKNQGLAPAAGYTNMLTIDENGKIGIVVSSAIQKDNIKSIKLNESFDLLEARAYNYKGKKNLEYGFIAEEIAKNEALKHAVIYESDGITPMSVNYQTIFVALTADYLATKKALKAELKMKDELLESTIKNEAVLKSELLATSEALTKLTLKYEFLEAALAQIANQLYSK